MTHSLRVKRLLAGSRILVKIFFALNGKKDYFFFMRVQNPLIFILIVLLAVLSCRREAGAESDLSPTFSVEYARLEEGRVVAAVWVTPPPGYYTYAHDDTGPMPVRLSVLDSSMRSVPVSVVYPRGQAQRDSLEPSRQALVYRGRFPVWITLPEKELLTRKLHARINLLLCSSRNCIPGRKDLPLALPASVFPLRDMPWEEAYREAVRRSGAVQGVPEAATPAAGTVTAISPTEALSPLPPESGAATARQLVPRFFQGGLEPSALGPALLLGFLAGLLLNVMPCVLPVLTIKLSGFLSVSGHEDKGKQQRHLREHAIFFSAGIMTWFGVLAGGVGGLGIAWGGLFQSPWFIHGLLLLVFLLALSMFGLFTLPVLDFKVASSGNPALRAYSAGLVATLLATPCSGPLLGGVLGWAVLQPLPVILAVFLATGMGMALPHLLLAVRPEAVRLLPRPGPWLEVMERLMGFFLLGTALYLLSILPASLHLATLLVLLITALAAWIWGKWGSLAASGRRRVGIACLSLSLAGGALWWSLLPPGPPVPWTNFHAGQFEAVLGKEPLLVEFTADWCPSCKMLEHTVLTPKNLDPLIRKYGLRMIRVDLTTPNPDGDALLRALGSISIPVTAIFPKGFLANSPLVLRDIYTVGQLEQALSMSLPEKKAGTDGSAP